MTAFRCDPFVLICHSVFVNSLVEISWYICKPLCTLLFVCESDWLQACCWSLDFAVTWSHTWLDCNKKNGCGSVAEGLTMPGHAWGVYGSPELLLPLSALRSGEGELSMDREKRLMMDPFLQWGHTFVGVVRSFYCSVADFYFLMVWVIIFFCCILAEYLEKDSQPWRHDED